MNMPQKFTERDSQTELNLGMLPESQGKKFWATPSLCGNHNRKGASATSGDGLATQVFSSVPDSLAKTYQPQESKRALKAPVPACFLKLSGLSKLCHLVSSSWRTWQISLIPTKGQTLELFSGRWPRSGTMQSGTVYQLPTLARTTGGIESGLWPTPNVGGGGNRCELTPHKGHFLRPSGEKAHLGLDQAAKMFPTPKQSDYKGTEPVGSKSQVHDNRKGNLKGDRRLWPTPRGSEQGVGMCGGTGHYEMLKEKCKDRTELKQMSAGGWWSTEPSVGRVAHGIPKRVDRLKGLGNSVVPQCVAYIAEIMIKPILDKNQKENQ